MRLEMIVEWSLGSPRRFEWDGQKLVPYDPPWQPAWGLPPVNYGLIPEYFNPADQAALDAIWASREPVAAGTRLEGEVLGMVWVKDGDHKIILGQPGSLEALDHAGLYTWFVGRQPRFTTAEEAIQFILSL
ncbi:inorganic diphosphatase [Meiothermus sp.]|uniref:inorganic diphosphatase n=1 Tax=Meiothermus sp. TaxID=1955249 RepID=UPI00307CEAC6